MESLFCGINYIQIDDINVEQLISNLETPAFGYEKKLVIVKNSGILKKEGKREITHRQFRKDVNSLGTAFIEMGLKNKRIAVVGGGTGNALAYPLATGMHDAGIEVDMIAGFKNKDMVILEDEFRAGTDNLYITTDDGSYGEKGFTTDKLKELIDAGNKYDEIVAVGPPMMMKFVCKIAEDYGIPSVASLTAYMVDGTGMCGGCRCVVGGENKFVCVDGPEFDGSKVDWDELIKRNSFYKEQEAEDAAHICRLTGGVRYHD